jgi:hypothetical protein
MSRRGDSPKDRVLLSVTRSAGVAERGPQTETAAALAVRAEGATRLAQTQPP